MTIWLLEESVLRDMESALRAGFKPTEEQVAAFLKTIEPTAAGEQPRNMRINSGTECEILIEGVLSKRPSFMSYYYGYGGCTYNDIVAALAVAAQDPNIKKVVLRIDSPGGDVDGLFETIAAIEGFSKPITTKTAKAQSGAYGLAAATNRIEATGPGAMIGSIGVAARYMVWPEEFTVTNTDSPFKRPDPRTDEGRAAITRELDAINDLFTESIARGRAAATGKNVTPAEVRKDYGQGATLLAVAARKLGMIDNVIGNTKVRAVSRAASGGEQPNEEEQPAGEAAGDTKPAASGGETETAMDLKTLKAAHPDVFEAAKKEGEAEFKAAGVAQERKRVMAHLKMAKQTGAAEVASKAIETGASVMDEEVHADYMSAALNRADRTARGAESAEAAAVVAGAPVAGAAGAAGKTADLGDQVVAVLKQSQPQA